MIRSTIAALLVTTLAAADFVEAPGRSTDVILPPAPEAAPRPVPRPLPGPELDSALLAASGVSGLVGWLVVNLDTGEEISSNLPDQAFAPASVAKLPTAAFALERLGPAFRFQTTVAATGPVVAEVLEGDLVLIGGGDPELDTDNLLPLILQTQEAGFKRMTGRFLVDAGKVDARAAIDAEQPVDAAYNPGISGLNLNFNRVRIKWTRKGIRVSARAARLDPDVTRVQAFRAASPGAPLFTHTADPSGETWQMSQEAMRRPGERWLPVKAPVPYAGEVFQGLAATYGMTLGPAEAGSVEAPRIVARHESRPLSQIISGMLKYSTNITAEAIGLAASKARTLESSATAMNSWAAEALGIPPGDPGFQFVNHSGLTTQSRVSPRRMTDLLRVLAARPGASHPRLPGPLAGFLKPHNVAAKKVEINYAKLDVIAKTGTMDYIRGLAGYVATPGGQRLAFAIFSNDLARRQGGVRRVNRSWLGKARGLERRLIRNWILTVDR